MIEQDLPSFTDVKEASWQFLRCTADHLASTLEGPAEAGHVADMHAQRGLTAGHRTPWRLA